MQFVIRFLTFITFIFVTESLYSQVESFSTDHNKFYDEMKSALLAADRVQGKVLADKLELAQKKNPLPGNRVDIMIASINEMLKKRYRAYPHFAPYIEALFASVESGVSDETFVLWDQSVRYTLKKKSSIFFADYLIASANFFKNGTIFKSLSNEWLVRGDWKLIFTDGTDPKVNFKSCDLVGRSKGDSSVVFRTSGDWLMFEEKWKGKDGTVLFTRAGMPKEKVNAQLQNYSIELKSPKFDADSVLFTHTDYFSSPVLGRLSEKVLSDQSAENAIYPQFVSYDKRVELKNLAQDVNYEGAFSFKGNKFVGSGDPENPAFLKFMKNGQVAMRAASLSYTFKENQISTDRAAVTIYLRHGEKIDSIYHPGLQFKYLTDKRELSMLRLGEGLVKTLYKNTYHDVNMNVEAIYWKIEEPRIQMAVIKGSTDGKADIFSNYFYRDFNYEKLMGVAETHPLSIINDYLKVKKVNQFTGAEMAKHFRDDISQIRQMLMRLSLLGLVDYNTDKDIAVVTEKFHHWVNSRSRRADYDVIEFNSLVDGASPNASLSLLDNNMKLFGIDKVALSDSQSVYVYPKRQEMLLKENMDFNFDGRISAGRLMFFGKKFDFFYNKFNMELENVDSVKIRVPSKTLDEFGQKPLRNVKTVIEGVKGLLEIDRPDNKSGLKSLARYPIFTSKTNSYTYYQRPSIEGNVYPRNSFHFQLDPFVIDSLDVFDTEKLALDGTFTSAGIFPDFREKLVIMEDYSLGFSRKTPSSGFEVYGGPGVYYDEINLSHKGLRGNGKLKYLASTAWSNNFRWYPDSMNTTAQKFEVTKTKTPTEYPDVIASDVYIHWEPAKDKFLIKNSPNSPLVMYNGDSKLYGEMNLTSRGMLGNGKMDVLESGEFKSKEFALKSDLFEADTMGFGLKNMNAEPGDTANLALDMANVKGKVSFKDREASMRSNSEESFVRFPINKYVAYMEELTWKMDKNEVDMNTKMLTDINLKGALFVSTKKEQDSLSFVSPKAKFVLSDKTIYANEVKYMDVADSRVFPADEKLVIRKDAFMEPLKGATIDLPKIDPIHKIKAADISVTGKFAISGTGKYDFKDELGNIQTVNIAKIWVDSAKQIEAKGNVTEAEKFSLNPQLAYKGDFLINSQNPELLFAGYLRLNHSCPIMKQNWMRFEGRVNPKEIYVPVTEEPRDEAKNILFNGFCFASDSSGIYPVMLSAKNNYSDYEVIKVSGFLFYDNATKEFRLGSKEKINDPALPGSYLSFNAATCSAYAEGKLDIGGKLGQVSTITSGKIEYDSKNANTKLSGVFGIKFNFDGDLMSFITEKLIAAGAASPIDLKESETMKAFGNILDEKRVSRLKADINEGEIKKLPDELEQSLLFTNLEFVWDKTKKCLVHSGQAGLMVVNGKVFNKMLNVKIQIDRKRGGDAIHIMIEQDSDNYYYFNYKNNIMTCISTNAEFNKKLTDLDSKKRISEGKDGIPQYQYMIGTQRNAQKFRETF